MALNKGDTAPDFTLKTKTGDGLKDISLSAHRGKNKVVLLFFPLAFTPVCQDELCTVSGGLSDYSNLNAVVYGLSVDSPFAQEAFAQANAIKIPLLSDFNKTVATDYGVLAEELIGLKGVAKRSVFVIDEEGTIRFSWFSDNPRDLPVYDDIKAALA